MKCFECDKEAEYFICSQEENLASLMKSFSTAKPGQIIPMAHPEKLKALCRDHWIRPDYSLKSIPMVNR